MVLLNDPKAFRAKQEGAAFSQKGKHFSRSMMAGAVRKNVVVFAGAAVAACVVSGGIVAGVTQVQTHRAVSHITPIVVPMTVGQGQSFWSIAQKYGSSDDYILDRVNALAKANGMSTHASLVPGQRILVPVSNPQEVARLQTHMAKR